MNTHGETKHILVVDDEILVQHAFRLLLEREGYVVEAVGSGEEALARLETATFDLVLTDNTMPGLSGAEMASFIKARWPSIPVVMLSGNPPQGQVAGVDLVLKKPSDIAVLVESLRQLLAWKDPVP